MKKITINKKNIILTILTILALYLLTYGAIALYHDIDRKVAKWLDTQAVERVQRSQELRNNFIQENKEVLTTYVLDKVEVEKTIAETLKGLK